MQTDLSPFDFIKAASESKVDLINTSDYPAMTEKQYNAFIVNRGFSLFKDTVLHANEMNLRSNLFPDAQFQYYRAVLRKGKRWSKWPKLAKDKDLDLIQKIYSCNRGVAKLYKKALSSDDLKHLHKKAETGG